MLLLQPLPHNMPIVSTNHVELWRSSPYSSQAGDDVHEDGFDAVGRKEGETQEKLENVFESAIVSL